MERPRKVNRLCVKQHAKCGKKPVHLDKFTKTNIKGEVIKRHRKRVGKYLKREPEALGNGTFGKGPAPKMGIKDKRGPQRKKIKNRKKGGVQ